MMVRSDSGYHHPSNIVGEDNYMTEGPLPTLLGARRLELGTGEDLRDVDTACLLTHSGGLHGGREGGQEASHSYTYVLF